LGDKERAAETLERAARAQREEERAPALLVGAPEDEARELLALGRRALATGEAGPGIERGLKALQRAVALAPELSAARLALAEALAKKGSPDEALRALDRGLAEAPPIFEEHLLRARLLLAKGERDEPAIEAFSAAL